MASHQNGIALEPSELHNLGSAYDAAWSVLARELAADDMKSVTKARTKLALIMLELARPKQLSADQLQYRGLQIYRELSGPLAAT